MKKFLIFSCFFFIVSLSDAQDKKCLEDLGDKLCLVSSEGKFGVINKKGDYIVPAYFDEVKAFGTAIWVKQNGKCGLFDRKGKIMIPIEFPSVQCVGNCDKEVLFEISDIGKKAIYITKQLDKVDGFIKVSPMLLAGKTEVSIKDWFAYVQDVKNNGYNYNYGFEVALPDTNKVEAKLLPAYRAFIKGVQTENVSSFAEVKNNYTYNSSFRIYSYHDKKLTQDKLESMMDFPVTGITHKQAQRYAEWLTLIYEKKVNAEENLPFKINFRLPSIEEWEQLALSGLSERFRHKKCFDSLDTDGNVRFNYNFPPTSKNYDNFIGKNFGKGSSNVNSFWSDFNGVYGLYGNVAEMSLENGWAKGGSFQHCAKEALVDKTIKYEEAQPWLGFRVVAEFKAVK